jgi:serine protease Do
MSEVTAEKARELRLTDVHGVLVTGVSENSPAARAGLAGNDVITDYNGQRVEGTLQFARLVRETPPSRTARLNIWRDGRSREISAEIAASPSWSSSVQGVLDDVMPRVQRRLEQILPQRDRLARDARLGILAQDVSGQLGAALGAPDGQGVLVTEVLAGSAAERGGLLAGDVIAFVDGERVRDTQELLARLRARTGGGSTALRVIRKGTETTVTVQLEAPRSPAPARSISI